MPGQGTIVATGAIGYPPGLANVEPERLQRAGRAEGHDDDQHLRPPRDPGRGVGLVPAPHRPAAPGRGRLLRRACSRRSASRRWPRAATPRPPSRRPSRCPPPTTPAAAPVADAALLQAVQAATSLVKAHRMHGHLAARLDPLGSAPVGDPALDPETVSLTDELMRRIPASVLRVAVPGDTFADALPRLRDTYTGTIAYEIEHISDHEQRVWLRQADRVRQPTASRSTRRTQRRLLRPPVGGGGARELPAQGLPGQEAVLDRGPRRAGADARRDDRAGLGDGRARGGGGHGPPRAAQRAGAHRRAPVRDDPGRVRGRADPGGGHRGTRGRHRRREVPLRRQRAPTPRRRAAA